MQNSGSAPAGVRTVYGRTRGGTVLEEYCCGSAERSLLLVSGFAAGEEIFFPLLIGWWNDFFGISEGEIDRRKLLRIGSLRWIPRFNADAFENGKNGAPAANLRGVDPDRNFNADWLAFRAAHPGQNDVGPFPESEIETAAFCARVRKKPPAAALLIRQGQNTLFYPSSASSGERDAALFFARYGALAVRESADDGGTMLRWLSRFGVPALELRLSPQIGEVRLRELLSVCAAGLLSG